MAPKENVPLNQFHRLVNFGPLIMVAAAFENQRTIAPIAWYSTLSQNPPLLGVAVGQNHLTHLLISKSGEFSVNIPGASLLPAVIYCGSTSGHQEDKFSGAGLTPVMGQVIKTPLVGECLAHLECRVVDKVTTGDHTLFIGQVVAAQIEKDYFRSEKIVDIKKAKILHHLGGQYFAVLGEELKGQ